MVLGILEADRCLTWLDVALIGRLATKAGATARLACRHTLWAKPPHAHSTKGTYTRTHLVNVQTFVELAQKQTETTRLG